MLPGGFALAVLAIAVPSASAQSPKFPQCPPVGNNVGCSQLIVVNPDGSTVVQADPAAPQFGYDGSEDTLIGIQNNSKKPVGSINLASTTADIFGFDQDGLCDPGSWPNAPAVTPSNCPGPQGFGTTGYEGPNNSFANLSSNSQTGTVNFTNPVQPGGSTYWGLEEALQVGQLLSGQGGHPIAGPVTVAKNNVVTFQLTCVGSQGCSGVVQLIATTVNGTPLRRDVTTSRKKKGKPKRKAVVIGSTPVSIASGLTQPLSVKPNGKGLKLLGKYGSFHTKVVVKLQQSNGGPQTTNVAKVKLTGKKKKHKK